MFKLCRSLNWVRWLRARNRADAVRLFPICTVRKIVSAKVRLYFKPIFGTPGVSPSRVLAVSCFKQTHDVPVRSRFYAQCRVGLKIFSVSFLRSFRSSITKLRSRACCINKPIVFVMTIFLRICTIWLRQLTARNERSIAIAFFLVSCLDPYFPRMTRMTVQ